MKITKIAQVPVPQNGQALQQALDPRMATMLRQALMGSGLSKEKVLPFLEQLFTSLGDVQISKVKELIGALQEDNNQVKLPQTPVGNMPATQMPQQ